MKYITGIHALNIEDNTECCGDWHTSALNWYNIELQESDNSIFKDLWIEVDKNIPEHDNTYSVANTLRAILDLMVEGKTRYLKGFKDDFICTSIYDEQFFNNVWKLKVCKNWTDIDKLMSDEYRFKWLRYKESKNGLESLA